MRYFILISGMILALASSASGETYVVNPEGTGDFPTIQAAIDAAEDGDIVELTDGTFTGSGNLNVRYHGKAITVRSQSGDPEACVIDGQGMCEFAFLFDSHEGPHSVLEGVTITHAGWASAINCSQSSPTLSNCILSNNWGQSPGAGMRVDNSSSPTLTNCVFSRNGSFDGGGGLYCRFSSSPTLVNCTFFRNQAWCGGGAVKCIGGSPTFSGCNFSQNEANHFGGVSLEGCDLVALTDCTFHRNVSDSSSSGGLDCWSCDSVGLENCVFSENSTPNGTGGGMTCRYCTWPSLIDCTFSGNSAHWTGGGLSTVGSTPVALMNCTFVGNGAPEGGGLHCRGDNIDVTVENTIFAFGTQGEAICCSGPSATPILTCCDIFGNTGGDWVGCIADQYGFNGNISENPLFCDPQSGDYTLHEDSPCAPFTPPNEECDLTGAHPIGCDPVDYACCFDEVCELLSVEECINAGGTSQQGIQTCEPNPCLPYPCCLGEVCRLLSLEECTNAGGTWQPAFESCDPNPCLPYACCFGGVCEILLAAECTNAGGEWLLGIRSCDPNPCSPRVFVVNPGGTGDFPTIQAAIDAAYDGDVIELTNGTFTGDGNRDLDYLGKAITVRSLGGNSEACVINCQGSQNHPHRGVYFHSGEAADSRLEHVTVRHAYAWDEQFGVGGGGVYCEGECSPTFVNCVFEENWADAGGGGMSCNVGASPTLIRCVFRANASLDWGAGLCCGNSSSPTLVDCIFIDNVGWAGAGASCAWGSSPTFQNCAFVGNDAGVDAGGGIHCGGGSTPVVTDCTFEGNSAYSGGGIDAYSSAPTFTRCTIANNTAEYAGGGACLYLSSASFTNCTIVGNAAAMGGGISCFESGVPRFENTIIAFSTIGEAIDCAEGADATLSCCDVYGNAGGDWVGCIAGQDTIPGNICEDPLFCGDLNPLLPYLLHGDSPCAPDHNPECGLIGAWPVGCGTPQLAGEVAVDVSRLFLGSNIPNPFVSSTLIAYTIPDQGSSSPVLLSIYGATGRLVRTLVDAPQSPGVHSITWDGMNNSGTPVAGGVYFYRLSVGGEMMSKRALSIR